MKTIAIWTVSLVVFGVVALTGFKVLVEAYAKQFALDFVGQAEGQMNLDALAIDLTKRVYEIYLTSDPQEKPFLLKLRPFVTHTGLPAFLRVEPGAIEVIELRGHCDASARTLAYLIQKLGYHAVQLNLIGRRGGAHTIVRVYRPDGTTFLVDPHTGLVPMVNQKVLSGSEVSAYQTAGMAPEEIWQPVSDSAKFHPVFRQFPDFIQAEQGSTTVLPAVIPQIPETGLRVGALDGSSEGTGDAAGELGLPVYWDYLGHRYDRGWTREMSFHQDARVTFVLVEDVRAGVITTDKQPQVTGNTVVYEVSAGETLKFHDGQADINWRTLNSYQLIDSIYFEAR
jgi:hypothetical protein